MNKTYHFKIFNGALSIGYDTVEECIEEFKKIFECLGVDYNDRDVKLFMSNSDGTWEVTEDGEFAD